MYAAEWPCCHDPLRFSLGSDDLSPQRGNPTRRTPNACLLLSSLSRVSRSCRAPLPSGAVPRARSASTRPPARGVRVCASRAHALTPFASLVLSLFFSSAFHLSFSQPLWQAPSLISDDSMRPPARRVRVCASRAHALTPFASHVLSLFFSSARAWREGLCVSRITPFASFCLSFRAHFTFHFLNPFGRRGLL